jgi:uncharacterized protein YbjT (DUF2867 family)
MRWPHSTVELEPALEEARLADGSAHFVAIAEETNMYAITGLTGQVGGALANKLLNGGSKVRAVLRDPTKADAWSNRGCEIAIAEMEDEAQLKAAFVGADGVFILPPSEFDPEPGFPEAKRVIDAVVAAIETTRPKKIVCLSTIGADASTENLLTQRTMMEDALAPIGLPVTFLRPGWFMENALWDVASARDDGVVYSFLQPAHRPVAMVATRDVGETAADLLLTDWEGVAVVALEGPSRISPIDLAAAFTAELGKPVRVELVPRESWDTLFRSQGMTNPTPRIRMLDGFNEGWIDFKPGTARKGCTQLAEVVGALLGRVTAQERCR